MVNSVILLSVVILLFLISAGLFITNQSIQGNFIQSPMGERMTKMSLSDFDKQVAKEMMDKNGDGKCDACGMPVEMCIDSGQMECNMDSKSTMGVLGSQHIHADLKIYLNGKALGKEFFEPVARDTQFTTSKITSSFIHVEHSALAEENVGDILHMHATGVPLSIFFKSVGMELPPKTKIYVNRKEISDYQNYVFKDLDKILITEGIGNLEDQLNSITKFSNEH